MSNSSVEANYKNYLLSLYQYMTVPIKDFVTIKPQLLSILQNYRPVKVIDYQWGISKTGKNKCNLIVHEFADRLKVREYFKTAKNIWYCCECARTSTASSQTDHSFGDLLFEHGLVFVKLEHECSPRQLSFVLDVQKLYKDKKIEEANALQKSVLGSEDSYVVTLPKNITGKSEKKTPKRAREEVHEQSLQCTVGEENTSFTEISPLIIDNNSQETLPPEALFDYILGNLEKYSLEQKDSVLMEKSKIVSLLKTHRPIKNVDTQYGLLANLRRDRRLIIFEWNDKKRVREYSKRDHAKYLWDCIECVRLYRNHKRYGREKQGWTSLLRLIKGIVLVQNCHDCKPRDYELVMQYQKFLEEGDVKKAQRMSSMINFTFGETSLANIKNTLDVDGSALEYEKKNDIASANDVDNIQPIAKTPSIIIFQKPSISLLEQICAKLNIEYRNRAEKLWDKIMFEQIDTDAIDIDKIETHKVKTESIYETLSIFFTGSSKQAEQIHSTIFEAFRNKLVSSGEISARKFDKLYSINDNVLTDKLLSFIAKFIPSRILIVEEKEIRMYGKWRPGLRKRVTLVLSYFDEFYSVVLKL